MDLGLKKKFEGGEKYPKGSDYRMFWMTITMNLMAQRSYDFISNFPRWLAQRLGQFEAERERIFAQRHIGRLVYNDAL